MSEEAKKDITLSENAQKIMDMVKELSVMELADLVKGMEEEFGVSAAAPVAVAAVAAADEGLSPPSDGVMRRKKRSFRERLSKRFSGSRASIASISSMSEHQISEV